ncbi:hypothetical protein [Formosa sp. S-31]|uniref:hypothetical protein n=1 Tax=Formosa sp. S-31 TaxID=2790949 RepID=UPI003EBBC14F
MEKLEQYTEQEWEKIAAMPQLIGGIMAGAGSSGLIGTGKEMFATVESFLGGKKVFVNNPVIQAIVPDTDAAKRNETMEDLKAQRSRLMDKIKGYQAKTPEALAASVLEDCSSAVSILEAKEDTQIVTEYKNWLLSIAEKVANSAKEGGFLGFGGTQFSEKEQLLFDKLKAALN